MLAIGRGGAGAEKGAVASSDARRRPQTFDAPQFSSLALVAPRKPTRAGRDESAAREAARPRKPTSSLKPTRTRKHIRKRHTCTREVPRASNAATKLAQKTPHVRAGHAIRSENNTRADRLRKGPLAHNPPRDRQCNH